MGRRVYADLDAFFRGNPDLTMQEVSNELGISLSMMSYLRSGLRQPRLTTALRIAERCNIPVESLLTKQNKELVDG